MNRLRIFSSILVVLVSCAFSQGALAQADVSEDRISAGDLIALKTFDDPDGSATLRVSRKGTIEHPYAGTISVAGMTEAQAARKLEGVLRGDYLIDPKVNITVVRATTISYVVLGAVNAPNRFQAPANRPITLLEAIAQAGDFKDVADKKRVKLLRREGGRIRSYTVNVKALMEDSQHQPIYLKDGDTIRVKESFL